MARSRRACPERSRRNLGAAYPTHAARSFSTTEAGTGGRSASALRERFLFRMFSSNSYKTVILSVAEGTSALLIPPMLLGAFRPPKLAPREGVLQHSGKEVSELILRLSAGHTAAPLAGEHRQPPPPAAATSETDNMSSMEALPSPLSYSKAKRIRPHLRPTPKRRS